MQPMKTMRVIQVGMGGWGRDWTRLVLQPDDGVSLRACVAADPAALAVARRERPFSGVERELLEHVAAQAALALENQRLGELMHQSQGSS